MLKNSNNTIIFEKPAKKRLFFENDNDIIFISGVLK